MNPRITEKWCVDPFSGYDYSLPCIDGECVGWGVKKNWLNRLDDDTLTAVRDCFIAQRKIIEELRAARLCSEAITSSCL